MVGVRKFVWHIVTITTLVLSNRLRYYPALAVTTRTSGKFTKCIIMMTAKFKGLWKYERCHCQKLVFLCGATFSGHVCQCVTKPFCLPKISIIMKEGCKKGVERWCYNFIFYSINKIPLCIDTSLSFFPYVCSLISMHQNWSVSGCMVAETE